MQTGQVIGRTDMQGEDPVDRIVGRGDFLSTIYQHLGIDFKNTSFEDFSGRPIPIMLSEGSPIKELGPVQAS